MYDQYHRLDFADDQNYRHHSDVIIIDLITLKALYRTTTLARMLE